MKNNILFLCLITAFVHQFTAQTYTTGVVNLSNTSGLAMTAKIDVGTQVNLTLTGPSGRWFALGFNASSMTNGTDVVGVHSSGTLSAFDCFLSGFSAPLTDAIQNWTINSDVVSGGVRTILASRPLNTGDANDFVFSSTPTPMSLIWARSSSASFSYSYHGNANRGVVPISFTQVNPPPAPTGSANQTFCVGATLTQVVANGTAIQWYATSTGGTPLPGNTALVNGNTYYASQTVNGLESTNRLAVTITLNAAPSAPISISGAVDFCYSANTQAYSIASVTGASSYVWTLPNGATGSSSSTTINLVLNPSFQSGTLSVAAQNNCGLSAPTNLLINQHDASNTILDITTCNPYVFNGQTYSQSGSYIYQGTSIWGCDSTITLNLTISPTIENTIAEDACGSFPWNGQTLFDSGTYIDTLQSALGCDSIVTLNLNVYPIEAIAIDSTVLDVLSWNGTNYSSSGSYTQNFTSIHGCDSTVTINLTIVDSGIESNSNIFKISPNPVGQGEWIFIEGLNSIVPYLIFNLSGQVIQKGTTQGDIQIKAHIHQGTYLLFIEGRTYAISVSN